MPTDLHEFQHMAGEGTPPRGSCREFGVGFEGAIDRLINVYVKGYFPRGDSAEKFVVGPYGSGKTHFLRQLLETAIENKCATAEVGLGRDLDITKTLLVYQEVARKVQLPGQQMEGLRGALKWIVSDLCPSVTSVQESLEAVLPHVQALDEIACEDSRYRQVLGKTMEALAAGNTSLSEAGLSWLEGGNVAHGPTCKALGVQPIQKQEENLFGARAMFSMCQFLRTQAVEGVVIAFDEAEQSVNVDRRTKGRIMSMLRSEIDSLKRVHDASVLILYAFTPDVVAEMKSYPALQQRISDPDPNDRFFDGNDYSPVIDLAQPYNDPKKALEVLTGIGHRLVTLFFDRVQEEMGRGREIEMLEASDKWALEIHGREASIQAKREMVKRTCSKLLRLRREEGALPSGSEDNIPSPPEDEV